MAEMVIEKEALWLRYLLDEMEKEKEVQRAELETGRRWRRKRQEEKEAENLVAHTTCISYALS